MQSYDPLWRDRELMHLLPRLRDAVERCRKQEGLALKDICEIYLRSVSVSTLRRWMRLERVPARKADRVALTVFIKKFSPQDQEER